MFLTEEQAKARLHNARNIFSEDFEPVPSEDTPEEDKPEAPEINEIDNLLDASNDPYKIRQRERNLKGQTKIQTAIGTVSHIIGPTSTGPLFGLSTQQTNAYQAGISTSKEYGQGAPLTPTNPERFKRMKSVKEQLAILASAKLKTALTSLTDEKIDECKATALSGIAKDMAAVMDKVTKETSKPESIHFHIFRPEMKTVSEYTTVQVSSPLIIPDGGL